MNKWNKTLSIGNLKINLTTGTVFKLLIPFFVFASVVIFFETKSFFARKHFFKSKLNSVIVKKEGNWSGGRSYDYVTKDNVIVTVKNHNGENLDLGDSIAKEPESWKYQIFRKDVIGEFKFYKKASY